MSTNSRNLEVLQKVDPEQLDSVSQPVVETEPLEAFFHPQKVAVVGATDRPGSVGRTILQNLVATPFGGTVYPVNPNRHSVLGIPAYRDIAAISGVDLAVIVTPASTIPSVINQCVEAGVKAALVISAGFKETGAEGVKLENRVLSAARAGGIRIIGPNCLGVMNPITGFNATFAAHCALPGNVGFISQSGALCTAVLDWSLKAKVGFSAFVSVGSMLDVNWGDLIYYLGDDPHTKSIVMYMESIGDAQSFLSAAREVALTKPIICIKAGRTSAAAKAAASHTGSLAGSDDVLDAAFRRSGVLRVNTIAELFYMADVLSKQPRPKGKRLTIVTNAGGPGVLATDGLILSGGELAEVSADTQDKLSAFLPAHWSHANPIDILGDADAERYGKSLEVAAQDPNTDGLLVVLTPQSMTDAKATAEHLTKHAKDLGKPVLAAWMGGDTIEEGERILDEAGIPTFPYADTAARVFSYMWQHTENLRSIYETPMLSRMEDEHQGRAVATRLIDNARKAGRTLLTENESKLLLASYGIPTIETYVATDEEEAIACADKIGYPVVLKLNSYTITHKSDVGGVHLNLIDSEMVRLAYRQVENQIVKKFGAEHFQGVTIQRMAKLDGHELIIGSSCDEQFGPVILFGYGGQFTEIFKDRALGLPPLTTTLAKRIMENTKVYTALKGARGRKAVDLVELEQLLVRFSQLVVEQPWIKEIDINPLIASPDQFLALDARVILHDLTTPEAELPKAAIRPYPVKYVKPWTLKDGTEVIIRPIRPEDEPMMVNFHQTLSESSVYHRYLNTLKLSTRVAHDRLARVCFIDYYREVALVAEYRDPKSGAPRIIGVARLTKSRLRDEAEFAIIISDHYQQRGLGSDMLRRLIEAGRDENLKKITGRILCDNYEMQRVCEKLGFTLTKDVGDPVVHALLEIS